MRGGGHVKGFDSEAPSNLDVHARTLFTRLNPVLKEVSHSPPNPPGLCSKYCFNVHPTPLQDALLVLESSDTGHFSAHYLPLKNLFIKVLPVACGAKAFFYVPSLILLYISKQQLPSSVFG